MLIILYLFIYALSYILIYDDNFALVKDYVISYSTGSKYINPSLIEHLFGCQPCLSFWISVPICIYSYGFLFFIYSFACYGLTSIISDITYKNSD